MVKKQIITGQRKLSKLSSSEPRNSAMATIKFPNPPVVAVESIRSAELLPFMMPAVPPPAIMARLHCHSGSILMSEEPIIAVPPAIARGVVMVSSR